METEPFPDHLVSLQYGWCHHLPWTDEEAKDPRQGLVDMQRQSWSPNPAALGKAVSLGMLRLSALGLSKKLGRRQGHRLGLQSTVTENETASTSKSRS